jgi:putative ABC transport system permease protein
MHFLLLILKNLRRNPLRSLLTMLAVVVLVAVFSIIVSFLLFFDDFMTEKNKDVKLIISERYRMMSLFERHYADQISHPSSPLHQELCRIPGFHPEKFTIWHFVAFTLDPEMKDKDKQFFVIATLPDTIATMTDGLEGFDPALVSLMREPPRSNLPNAGLVMGVKRMAKLNLRVGDRFKAISVSHRDGTALRRPIEMDFEIVGSIPAESRWNDGALMDYAYLDRVLQGAKNELHGKINYAWLQVDDQEAATQTAGAIERRLPDLKAETAASAYSRFMEPLKNMLWWVKWFLVPAILVVMTLILANTFSLTVRERQTEIAVLKVLGFRSGEVLLLVLGEAVLVGALAGLAGALATFAIINYGFGGIVLQGLPVMKMPPRIFAWGPVIGIGAALLGGLMPALNARSVKVARVFANVA